MGSDSTAVLTASQVRFWVIFPGIRAEVSRRLRPYELCVFRAIVDACQRWNREYTWLQNRTLADQAHVSEGHVRRAIAALEELGLLRRELGEDEDHPSNTTGRRIYLNKAHMTVAPETESHTAPAVTMKTRTPDTPSRAPMRSPSAPAPDRAENRVVPGPETPKNRAPAPPGGCAPADPLPYRVVKRISNEFVTRTCAQETRSKDDSEPSPSSQPLFSGTTDPSGSHDTEGAQPGLSQATSRGPAEMTATACAWDPGMMPETRAASPERVSAPSATAATARDVSRAGISPGDAPEGFGSGDLFRQALKRLCQYREDDEDTELETDFGTESRLQRRNEPAAEVRRDPPAQAPPLPQAHPAARKATEGATPYAPETYARYIAGTPPQRTSRREAALPAWIVQAMRELPGYDYDQQLHIAFELANLLRDPSGELGVRGIRKHVLSFVAAGRASVDVLLACVREAYEALTLPRTTGGTTNAGAILIHAFRRETRLRAC